MATEADYILLRDDLGLTILTLTDIQAAVLFAQALAQYPTGSASVQSLATRVIISRRQWQAASDHVDYTQNEESERLGQLAAAKKEIYLDWLKQLNAAIAADAETVTGIQPPPSGSVKLRAVW